jgi:hypothetical protein
MQLGTPSKATARRDVLSERSQNEPAAPAARAAYHGGANSARLSAGAFVQRMVSHALLVRFQRAPLDCANVRCSVAARSRGRAVSQSQLIGQKADVHAFAAASFEYFSADEARAQQRWAPARQPDVSRGRAHGGRAAVQEYCAQWVGDKEGTDQRTTRLAAEKKRRAREVLQKISGTVGLGAWNGARAKDARGLTKEQYAFLKKKCGLGRHPPYPSAGGCQGSRGMLGLAAPPTPRRRPPPAQ